MDASYRCCRADWIEVSLALQPAEIDELGSLLKQLRDGQLGHFHLTRVDWIGESGIADVEVSLQAPGESAGGMQVG